MTPVESVEASADRLPQALLPAAAVVCAAMLTLSLWAWAAGPSTDELIESLHACAANGENSARLRCYDGALAAAHPAKGANAPVLLH